MWLKLVKKRTSFDHDIPITHFLIFAMVSITVETPLAKKNALPAKHRDAKNARGRTVNKNGHGFDNC